MRCVHFHATEERDLPEAGGLAIVRTSASRRSSSRTSPVARSLRGRRCPRPAGRKSWRSWPSSTTRSSRRTAGFASLSDVWVFAHAESSFRVNQGSEAHMKSIVTVCYSTKKSMPSYDFFVFSVAAIWVPKSTNFYSRGSGPVCS